MSECCAPKVYLNHPLGAELTKPVDDARTAAAINEHPGRMVAADLFRNFSC